MHVVAQVRDDEGDIGKTAKFLAGKPVNDFVADGGTLLKSAHGTCLRAYSPAEQTELPCGGRLSAYPVNVRCAAISSEARFAAPNVSGQLSLVTPWVLPENKAR